MLEIWSMCVCGGGCTGFAKVRRSLWNTNLSDTLSPPLSLSLSPLSFAPPSSLSLSPSFSPCPSLDPTCLPFLFPPSILSSSSSPFSFHPSVTPTIFPHSPSVELFCQFHFYRLSSLVLSSPTHSNAQGTSLLPAAIKRYPPLLSLTLHVAQLPVQNQTRLVLTVSTLSHVDQHFCL